MIHRNDIDGLRALAVLAVVAFHLGVPLHGGYVGVDVFFTISGYLIGSIILRESAEGKFSFLRFYERRIRRIAPALVAMLVATSAVAYRFLLPLDFAAYARSLIAAALSISNLEFWREAGYFDAPSAAKPLLHTWSLAVEEQFYIFFPILVMLARKLAPVRMKGMLFALGIMSFVLSAWGAYAFPTQTFYGIHTRAWELLIGTAVALWNPAPTLAPKWRETLSALGLLMVLAPMFLYKERTTFPGLAALPPCLGTALIIAMSQPGFTWVSRMFALRPVVWVGLVSYSLYLWHWPLIAFSAYGLQIVNGLGKHQNQATMFAAMLVVSALSWRFIEQPFRTKQVCASRASLFVAAAIAFAAAAAAGGYVVHTDGMSRRFPPAAQRVAAWIGQDPLDGRDQYRNGVCFLSSASTGIHDFNKPACLAEKTPRVLLIGDSHAAALWWGLNAALPGINVMQATASGCKPVLNQRPRQVKTCADLMTFALTDYLRSNKVDAVIIVGKWDADDLGSLGETVHSLTAQAIPTIVVGPMVQYDAPLPRLLAYAIVGNDPGLPARHRLTGLLPLDTRMRELAASDWHVPYFSMFDALCADGHCLTEVDGDVPLLSDYGHVTKKGAEFVAGKMVEQVELLRRERALGTVADTGVPAKP